MEFDYRKDPLTEEVVIELDNRPASKCGTKKGVVWLRNDYLCMSGMCYSSDRQLYDFLQDVIRMKEYMIEKGYVFNSDRWYEGEIE